MENQASVHKPVLLKEILDIFNPKPGENYIDATINGGGHAKAILERIGSEGKLLGIDWDCKMIGRLEKRENLILACDNFANLKSIIERLNFKNIKGVLFDLGFSSIQIEKSGRGFSFSPFGRSPEGRQVDEPLDMRFNPMEEASAADIVNGYSQKNLANVIWKYGEERYARRIARTIVEIRRKKKIATTFGLVEAIRKSVPGKYLHSRVHFATRTFQALRIETNHELENLTKGLEAAYEILDKEGKIIVISFHSLEDRIAKNFLKEKKAAGLVEIVTKKPIRPGEEEISQNPRARSAKLRAAIKLANSH